MRRTVGARPGHGLPSGSSGARGPEVSGLAGAFLPVFPRATAASGAVRLSSPAPTGGSLGGRSFRLAFHRRGQGRHPHVKSSPRVGWRGRVGSGRAGDRSWAGHGGGGPTAFVRECVSVNGCGAGLAVGFRGRQWQFPKAVRSGGNIPLGSAEEWQKDCLHPYLWLILCVVRIPVRPRSARISALLGRFQGHFQRFSLVFTKVAEKR